MKNLLLRPCVCGCEPVAGPPSWRKQTPLPTSSGLGGVISFAGALQVGEVEEATPVVAVLCNVLSGWDDVISFGAERVAATECGDLAEWILREDCWPSPFSPVCRVIETTKAASPTPAFTIAIRRLESCRLGNRRAARHLRCGVVIEQ
jgi:hypothetical protein